MRHLFVSRALLCLALVVACSGGGATPSPTALSLGSNYSDEVPKAALQQVIDGFNGVFPGGDYEGQKNIFAGFNEQTCPLN